MPVTESKACSVNIPWQQSLPSEYSRLHSPSLLRAQCAQWNISRRADTTVSRIEVVHVIPHVQCISDHSFVDFVDLESRVHASTK